MPCAPAGYEIGVASTKAYTSQIVALTMVALALAEDSIAKREARDQVGFRGERAGGVLGRGGGGCVAARVGQAAGALHKALLQGRCPLPALPGDRPGQPPSGGCRAPPPLSCRDACWH
jgi:hypothetical protein